jgi:hypothetical protein
MQITRFRPSPALVVATIALAVALGGTGYAAISLPANSVGTKQLRNGAVNAAKIKKGSLNASSFAPGQLPRGPKGDRGADGLPGAAGPQGPQGTKGDAATKLFAVVGSSGEPVVRSPGVNSTKLAGSSNRYRVTFPQSVSGCAPVVTVGVQGGSSGHASVDKPNPGATTLDIETFDAEGDDEGIGFAIAVFC